LQSVDEYEIDEILILSLLLIVGLIIDTQRAKLNHQKRLSARQQRIRSLKNTMTAVHDIVNNSLNDIKGFDLNNTKLGSKSKKKLSDGNKKSKKKHKTD
jgi:hypothetical protein